MTDLSDMFKGYVALERFVAPEYAHEAHAGVPPSRAELGAMLHMFNTEILRRLRALLDATAVLQAQLNIDSAQAPAR